MKILIKGDTCSKVIKISCKSIPEFVGLPVIENLSTAKIIGYSWFNLVERSHERLKMPIFKFHHFKIKP